MENGSTCTSHLDALRAGTGLPSSCHTLDRQAHRPGLWWWRKTTRPSLRLHRVSKGRDVRGHYSAALRLQRGGHWKRPKITRHKMARVCCTGTEPKDSRKSGGAPTYRCTAKIPPKWTYTKLETRQRGLNNGGRIGPFRARPPRRRVGVSTHLDGFPIYVSVSMWYAYDLTRSSSHYSFG